MLDGSDEDRRRIGVEPRYAVAKQSLGLEDLAITEPVRGRRALYSRGGSALPDTRMLDLSKVAEADRQKALHGDMDQMVDTMREDLRSAPAAEAGYAILSYILENKLVSIWISEVRKPK